MSVYTYCQRDFDSTVLKRPLSVVFLWMHVFLWTCHFLSTRVVVSPEKQPAKASYCTIKVMFTISMNKCHTKFDCLIYEMLFIRNIKPKLNTRGIQFAPNFLHNNIIECFNTLLIP